MNYLFNKLNQDGPVVVSLELSLKGERTPKVVQVKALEGNIVYGRPQDWAYEAISAYAHKRGVEVCEVRVNVQQKHTRKL